MTYGPADQKRIWQYAFVLGIASSIAAAIAVFGLSTFTTALTITGIIVGVFNALLGSSKKSKDGNWFLSRVKHSLYVSGFLKVATIVVWLTTIGLVSYGVVQYRRESQRVTLTGRVLTAGGDPAANAHVVLLTRNKREAMTSSDGGFVFSSIDLGDEPTSQVKIEVDWKAKTGAETVDLAKLTSNPVTIKLNPGDAPFRVSYITLEGPAIDLFLRGEIDRGWDERLGGKPYIVSNGVFQTLQYLSKHYSTRMYSGEGVETTIETKGEPKEDPRLGRKLNGSLALVGSEGDSIESELSENDLLGVFNAQQHWTAGIGPGEPENILTTLYFWRFAKQEDLEKFRLHEPGVIPRNTSIDFYKYITRNAMPTDFCLVAMVIGGCGEGNEVLLKLVPRKLKLRVAVLENVTSEPIQIGKFTIREFKEESLRSREEGDAALKALNPEPQDLFPPKILAPNEKLVIPLEMPMAYDKETNFEVESLSTPPDGNTRRKVTSKLSATEKFTVTFGLSQTFDWETSRLLQVLNRPGENPLLDKEYLFGPAVGVESVYVDNVNYPFRQQDVSRVVVRAEGTIGSCPFVYTYSVEAGSWENEGHILYRQNSSFKEATVEKPLERFDGRILIKEIDPEVSFIDFIYIKAIGADGVERRLYPNSKPLRSHDGDYLRMKQGDQMEVSFEGLRDFTSSKYVLVARGYYLPFTKTRQQLLPKR
jgi:hypothetical protein